MPAFAVVTAFKGVDGVSKPLKKMSRAAKAFDKASDRAFSRASKRASMFGSVLKGVLGAQVISGGINMLRRGVSDLTTEFIDFDRGVTKAAAKFPEGIKRGTAAFKALGAAARKTGSETKFTAAEAAGALNFFAMAGFNSAQAMSSLAGAAELATNADIDLIRSSDIATDTLGIFGLMTKDATKLTLNMTRVNNVLAKTANSANTDMEQLFETMKFGGKAAKNAGASIETFSALSGVMASEAIKSSMAGTAMRSMYVRLAKPPRDAEKVLKKLGVTVEDSQGNFRDVIDIMADFSEGTKEMGTRQRSAAIATVFGVRAIAGVTAILDKGKKGLLKYRNSLIESTDASKDMAVEINKSIENRLLTLKSSVIEVGFKFIDVFEKQIPIVINAAINAVRKFDVKKALTQMHRFGLFIERTVILVKDLSPLIWAAVAAYTAYRVVLIGVMAVQAIRFFATLINTLRAATASQTLLNLAMTANPIGLIVVGIGLLVAAIVLLVKNWDTVSEVMQEFWIDFKAVMGKMWNWFSKMLDNPFFAGIATLLAPFITIPAQIIKNWEPIKAFFREVYDVIKPIIDLTEKGIAAAADFLGIGADKKIGIEKSIRPSSEDKRTSPREAPNKKELASKAQIDFQGSFMFGNAPPGGKLEGKTRGAPPIQLDMSGQN